jgi:hypothetical protein
VSSVANSLPDELRALPVALSIGRDANALIPLIDYLREDDDPQQMASARLAHNIIREASAPHER